MRKMALAAAMIAATIVTSCDKAAAPKAEEDASSAKATVETVYSGFASGDIDLVVSAMSPEIDWREAEGNPYADKNPYIGPDAILSGVFARLGGEWDGFAAKPEEFVSEGDRVIVFGRYNGVYLATGKKLDAPFVHSWTVKDGKVVKFQQYTNTAAQVEAMTGGDN